MFACPLFVPAIWCGFGFSVVCCGDLFVILLLYNAMAGRWSAMDPLSVLSDASDSDSEEEEEEEDNDDAKQPGSPIHEVASSEKNAAGSDVRKPGLNYEALSRHGYSGGLSILHVPAPRGQAGEQDWSWSAGKRKNEEGETEETYEDREQTRQLANNSAATAAEEAVAEYNFTKKQRRDAITEQKALSFSQKEKRKRDMGQSSRGKNYVEEEKRLLRDQGVYSGFDT
ncbi:hypothetical protein BDL97_04G006900 [Sphagnum fallax]|nr:hypothetical protein BDL97_04G006900 [Sphagnum fallax]KAH8963388.1 hypothetical protein BDL97_04G006900 [Sphagnum fallax]